MNTVFNASGADPLRAILAGQGDSVLAIIAGVEGPSYRPLGAMMACMADGTRVGTLSSGCIEADISLHAAEVLAGNTPRVIRYGAGSPFIDIELPCGGGLDILLLPRPDLVVLAQVDARRVARDGCTLVVNMDTGALALADTGATMRDGAMLSLRFDPDIRFLVFGKGPEAGTFSALVKSAGYPITLYSPDRETLQSGESIGCATQHLSTQTVPDGIEVDAHSVIVLFFHDHDWEPPILHWALGTDAFYIGSQGSHRARAARDSQLSAMGVAAADISRLRGPIGLIPSARDAGTLAVSVFAEVLAEAMK